MSRAMPAQRPGKSVQEVGTPREFLDAVEKRFGRIGLDVAADTTNAVCSDWIGPGGDIEDALTAQAGAWEAGGWSWSWLNPPFGKIAPWAQRCVLESDSEGACNARLLFLVPASVGSNWFNHYVRPNAYVLELAPRIKFVGHTTGFPKDLLLCVFTPERLAGRAFWRWKP